MKKTVFFVCLVALGLPFKVYGDGNKTGAMNVDQVKEKYIREVIRVTGVAGMTDQILNALVDSLKKENPRIKKGYWVEFRKEMKGDELITRIIPVYDKYFSTEELKSLVKFYDGPLGQKVLTTLPGLTQECNLVEQNWAKETREKLNIRLYGNKK